MRIVRTFSIAALTLALLLGGSTPTRNAMNAAAATGVVSTASGEVIGWGDNIYDAQVVPADLHGVTAISAGGHSLALRTDGSVVAWGDNRFGQATVPAGAASGVRAISAGGMHSLALRDDGTLVAWGLDMYGQARVPPAAQSGVVAIAAGSQHNIVLKSDGSVVAWGQGHFGETIPPPAAQSGVTAVAAGALHSMVLKSDGSVVAWGSNFDGETDVPAAAQSGVTAIAAAGTHSLALKADGTVVAWGSDTYGESTVPPGLDGVVSIAAGSDASVALKADGTVVAWGHDDRGQSTVPTGLGGVTSIAAGMQYGLALRADTRTAGWGWDDDGQATIAAAARAGVRDVAAGHMHSIALRGDGTVVAWGSNVHGQTNVPAGLADVTAVGAGAWHSVALRADGTVVAWSSDVYPPYVPVPAGLTGVTSISTTGYANLALKADGTVRAWGYDAWQVPPGLRDVTAVAAGDHHSVALKADGTVVAWGWNYKGQTSVPVGLRDVVAVAAGTWHTVALRADGTVVAWGSNENGETAVPTAAQSGIVAIAAKGTHTLALKADGTLVAWGDDSEGQSTVPAGLGPVTGLAPGYLHNIVLHANRAPTIEAIDPQTGAEGAAVRIEPLASDADGDTLTFTATGLPPGVTIDASTGAISGVLTYDSAGNYDVQLSATDGGLSASTSFTWSVSSVASVSIGSASVVEGNGGAARRVSFAVTLSQPGTSPVKIGYYVTTAAGGHAIAPYDFAVKSGYLVLSPSATNGETPISASVAVDVAVDDQLEGDETFAVVLTGVSGTGLSGLPFVLGASQAGLPGAATAVATIIDDDAAGGLLASVGDADVFEGDVVPTRTATNTAKVWVNLSAPSATAVSVDATVAAGTATAGSDFTKSYTSTLTFQPGTTQAALRVPVKPDTTVEGNETVTITLSNATGGASIGRSEGTVTILNDD